MTKKDDFILKALNVVSWVIFIGLCVEAGALIFNFIFTLFKPIASHGIYKGLNLSELYINHFAHYVSLMSFVLSLAILKAYLFYFVVQIFTKLNLGNPFNTEIAKLIEKIGFEAFVISIISIVAHQYTKGLMQDGFDVDSIESYWNDSSAFMMMAAILFIISQIFKKGIELQNENDLTV
ncbi:MAG: DUF2975 domain-containing protein [Flavobacteriales bacterium]|nr:DUF2975 domain-containing protein [Crocinitomicaceae bacterium]NBX80914.1 DUF2975 domain-containing protein [Flavobacteriales bacterium]NCA22599.1 DUF2975 domain-containing protein [Crocinitomicaceae bacterium]